MSNVIQLDIERKTRIPVQVSVDPLIGNLADVLIVTPDNITAVTVPHDDAAVLMQRLKRTPDPIGEIAGFLEAHGG